MARKKKQPSDTAEDAVNDADRSFYVYIHKIKESGEPFYVGKGKGDRAYDATNRNSDWHDFVRKIYYIYDIEIAQESLTELEAWDLEISLIAKFGKRSENTGTLVNLTDDAKMKLEHASHLLFPQKFA